MKYILSFLLIFSSSAFASDYKLEKVISGLTKPWGMSFINDDELFLTQKTGEILKINIRTQEIINYEHDLKVVSPHWQAGMLDILYHNKEIFVSYTELRDNDQTSTSIARGVIDGNKFKTIENIFQSEPPLWDNLHWGSRLMIKDNLLYLSLIHI